MGLQLVIRDMKAKLKLLGNEIVDDGEEQQDVEKGLSGISKDPTVALTHRTPSGNLEESQLQKRTSSASANAIDSGGDGAFKGELGGFLKLVEESNDSCEIAIDILNDILTYDKLDSNDLKLHTREICVRQLVMDNCKGFANQARNLGVTLDMLQCETDIDLDNVFVAVDSAKIGQVLRNLISNALKFTPTDGRIEVSARFAKEMSVDAPVYNSFQAACEAQGVGHSSTFGDTRDNADSGDVGVTKVESPPPNNSFLSNAYSSFEKISEGSKKHYIRIDVKDSGVGLSKDKQQQLFDGIVQFEDRSSINRFGAGLGLFSK